MPDDHDERIEQVSLELKRQVRVDAAFDDRVMQAVRRLPKHTRFWSRITTPRRVMVSPLSWGMLAATLLAFAALGTQGLVDDAAKLVDPVSGSVFTAGSKSALPARVQFVLVAPDAKKVAVVGDFNGWDASHEGYQAEHRGGGVWSVMAPVPVGHHKYSFVVDDSVWVADPVAPRAVDNDFGVTNSALVVLGQE